MSEFLVKFFDTGDFPARWQCGNWSDFLGWLHIGSDLATFAAYYAIPIVLVYFARKRRDFPFKRIFWLFAAFISACGTVHLIEAVIFYYPIYRISGLMKLFTAIVSWGTVIALIRYLPLVMHYPSLADTNERLKKEIIHRQKVERDLLASQAELLSQKSEMDLMYKAAPVGMSLVGPDLRYIRINDRLADIHGLSREAHLGKRIRDVLPDLGQKIERFYQRILKTGEAQLDNEITGTTDASSKRRTWLASYYPLKGEDGVIHSISAVVQDITQRKETERRLKQSEAAALAASQSKSEFLANMSHEIRTPMAAILGYADVLLGHLKDPDNRNCVLIMKRNGEHLLELINDILDLSRIEAGKMDVEEEPVALPHLVADIESLMQVRAEEKKVIFEVDFEGHIPHTIKTDPTRLRQVLINLIGNAIKFTDEGEVRLKVKFIEGDETPLIEFAIIDTGIGMSPDQIDRLFKPFSQGDSSVTRQYGGSGLGLAISQRLVQMLNGKMELESKVGEGSTFYVHLPVSSIGELELVKPDLLVKSSEPRDLLAETPKLTGRILVVDDRRDVRHISQHFLEKAGATVSTAEDGQEGIDMAIAARDAGKPFDLVVMDMQMPNVDGMQAVAELRSAGIEWPIVALTADAMKGDRDKCLNGGCDDYLSKPIDHAKLIQMAAKFTQSVTADELRQMRSERAAKLHRTLTQHSSNE
ncbi:ATP-binding protein [Rubripirellula amarantea]|uniref:histidine kinase n=1 Tax=Rubripirellula amarantea TaxID=2527999 RepID=A0A5C5WXZ8_9BACT|nr:PAS domain-containing sensor histidine kinase [Rubripirellula amarantea]MDA8746219.1 ATP-binding protein [Rubripirellula amarantea]TWT54883.1 Autoinducer 2 sensor kinase/phosphatase LuxQ [Rubripirellula amarantea]